MSPLATPQQVMRSVDVGRQDPFAGVLSPLEISHPATQLNGAGRALNLLSKGAKPLTAPQGLEFQGVLQGPRGVEALVEYTPEDSKEGGLRAGSLRVGDTGTGRKDSLLPPGWRVEAIDGSQGVLVLQKNGEPVSLSL
jgi:hypothetical protein